MLEKIKSKISLKYWSKPREGNHVSGAEFVSWCAASMGLGGWNPVFNYLILSAGTATLCGLIYQLKPMDVFAITLIGTVLTYASLPLGPYIVDNMGRFPKKVTRFLLLGGAGALLLAGGLWVLPALHISSEHAPEFLSGFLLLPDLFKHIAVRIVVFVLTSTLQALTLRIFGKKFGKFKPFMIFYGPIVLLLVILLVNVPYQNMSYSRLLLAAHFLTATLDSIKWLYCGIGDLQNRISPNPQERSKIMSIAPIFTGLLRSVYSGLFPAIALYLGGVENIRAYRVILPIYCAMCLGVGLLVLRVRERVIQEEGHVARAKLRDSAAVFRNKYQWIKCIAEPFNKIPNIWEGVITWLCIYYTRLPWAYGLMISLYKLPTSTTGQLMTPYFTKRFSKRQNILFQRLLIAVITAGLIPCLGIENDTLKVVLLMLVCCLRTFFGSMNDVVVNTLTGDIWDYQQWKSGERLEGSLGNYFKLVMDPLYSLIGYILPFLLARIGFLGDMDTLYDSAVFFRYTSTQVWFAVGMTVISALPFVFYDLTPKKLEQINADLRQRVADAKGAVPS